MQTVGDSVGLLQFLYFLYRKEIAVEDRRDVDGDIKVESMIVKKISTEKKWDLGGNMWKWDHWPRSWFHCFGWPIASFPCSWSEVYSIL